MQDKRYLILCITLNYALMSISPGAALNLLGFFKQPDSLASSTGYSDKGHLN